MQSAVALRIPLIEVGFKLADSSDTFRGLPATTPWEFFGGLPRSPASRLGFMVNERDFSPASAEAMLDGYTSLPEDNDFVRVATNIDSFLGALELAAVFRDRGLAVFVNVMQVSLHDPESLLTKISKSDLSLLEALYFADSFGAMSPKSVGQLFSTFHVRVDAALGFHGHESRGLALANSLEAIENGATYIDGSYGGIGRGSGNTKTEQLLAELSPWGEIAVGFEEFVAAGDGVRSCLPESARIGSSPEYSLAARSGIHPTYVQELTEKHGFSRVEVLAGISELGRKEAASFKSENLSIGADWFAEEQDRPPNRQLLQLLQDETVLIVGSGESANTYEKEILNFASKYELCTLGVGPSSCAELLKPNLVCVSNPLTIISGGLSRILTDVPIVAPWGQIPSVYGSGIPETRRIRVDFSIGPNEFNLAFGEPIKLPNYRSSTYAVAVALSHGAKRVIFAGFDGYPDRDWRNEDFLSFLTMCRRETDVRFYSLTETFLDVEYVAFG